MALLITAFLLAMLIPWFFHMVFWVRPERPFTHARNSLKFLASEEVLLRRALPAFVYLYLLMSAYSGLKANIPNFNEYSWDPALADLDRWIFGTARGYFCTRLFPA